MGSENKKKIRIWQNVCSCTRLLIYSIAVIALHSNKLHSPLFFSRQFISKYMYILYIQRVSYKINIQPMWKRQTPNTVRKIALHWFGNGLAIAKIYILKTQTNGNGNLLTVKLHMEMAVTVFRDLTDNFSRQWKISSNWPFSSNWLDYKYRQMKNQHWKMVNIERQIQN